MNTYNKKKGITYIILAAFFFSLMSFFVALAGDVPSMQKAFFRNVVAMCFAMVILARTEEGFKIKKGSIPLLVIRSSFGLIGVICNFYALSHIAISDANMLNKLSPFFAIIFSYFVLSEKANLVEWTSVIVAFGGALLIIKPGFDLAFFPAMIGALSGLTAGIAYTFVRLLGKHGERGPVIVFFFSAFSTIALLPNLILNYQHMSLFQWFCLIMAGFMAMGGQMNITNAYTYAPAKEISIYDYSQIVFAAILGFLFLGQIPDLYSILGYIIIIGAALFRWFYNVKK